MEEERKPTPTPTTLIRDVKSKSTSILKKRPLAPSNSADSPLVSAKLVPEPTTSPVDLQPPALVSPTGTHPMSPKPSTIQRLQSLFRHTPRKRSPDVKVCLSVESTFSLASNRVINQLKTNSAAMAYGSPAPAPASPIAILQKTSLAMRKQTPKRRYRLRNRVNSNQ